MRHTHAVASLFAVPSLALASLFTLPCLALAQNEWKHLTLTSAQGNTIQIDYTTGSEQFNGCYKCGSSMEAKSLWVNVTGPHLTSQSQVQIVTVGKSICESSWNQSPISIRQLNLDLRSTQPWRFGNELQNLEITRSPYAGGKCRIENEIAVVIDGEWQVDPINQSSNFLMNLVP